jgi:hypothetical protein
MICNRVHLLELCHVNITESTSLRLRLSNFPSSRVDSTEQSLGLHVFARLRVFLSQYAQLDSFGVFAYVVHQIPSIFTQVGLGSEFEIKAGSCEVLR